MVAKKSKSKQSTAASDTVAQPQAIFDQTTRDMGDIWQDDGEDQNQ